MSQAWPAVCTLVALAALLYLIIRVKFQAFAALLVVSLALGLTAGLKPEAVATSIGKGIGDILASVAVILGLGAMLGRMLEASGAAEVIARTLVDVFGVGRASWAILIAGYIIGIPVLFNVGFLLLIPIMWRLQRDTGRSLLWFVLPLGFSLGTAHSLIPPHPGIIGAVENLGGNMIQTMVFGTLMGIPILLAGWVGPGRWWASRQFVTVPEHLAAIVPENKKETGLAPPSFALCVFIVTMPLLLSLVGFGVKLLSERKALPERMSQPLFDVPVEERWLKALSHSPADWLGFLGHPTMALLIPTALAFLLLGARRGMGRDKLSKLAGDALQDIGVMALLFGAAGGFKQVIQDTGAGRIIAVQVSHIPLSPVVIAYLTAALVRIALGSATASILMASALLADMSRSLPGQETLLVLAVANGVTVMSQPGDSGFWLVKEYCNLSVKQVLIYYNSCRAFMSLVGLALLLLYEALFVAGR